MNLRWFVGVLAVLVNFCSSKNVYDVEELGLGQEQGKKFRGSGRNKWRGVDSELDSQRFERRELSFMVSGRNLDPKNKVSPRLTFFYQTADSDLNSQKTEISLSNGNPDWTTIFKFNWIQGSGQKWDFKVRDFNKKLKDVHPLLGSAEVDVDAYVENDENLLVNLEGSPGQLFIKKVESFKFKLGAKNLPMLDAFGGYSDPYVECFWRRGPDGVDVYLGKTSVEWNTVHVEWKETFTFKYYQKGSDQYLHFKVYDHDSLSGNDFLGEAFLRLDRLNLDSEGAKVTSVKLINGESKTGEPGSLIIKT